MGEGMTAETPQKLSQGMMMMGRQVQRAQGRSLGSNSRPAAVIVGGGAVPPPPPPPLPWSSVGVATAPVPAGSGDPSAARIPFFSPRSAAAAAKARALQPHGEDPYDDDPSSYYRRDFSPPPAFDPPRATTLRPAPERQRTTEIQPRRSGRAAAGAVAVAQCERQPGSHPPRPCPPNHHLQGPTPSFPPYYYSVAPGWPQQQHHPTTRQPPPFPMPAANAWQQHHHQQQQQHGGVLGEPSALPLSLSSTSMLPDPRVSAIAYPPAPSTHPAPPPPSGSHKKSRPSSSFASGSAGRPNHPPHWGVVGPTSSSSTSQPPPHMGPDPAYYSQSRRPRPAPHTFVTPTPKKLRWQPSDPSASAPGGGGMMMDPSLPLPPYPSYHHGQGGAASTFMAGGGVPAVAPNNSAAGPNPSYSRKTKSLGVLAENFCQIFASRPPFTEIVVDSISADLGVERRRIYDVVNILESIRVVVKKAKNTYCWMGSGHLPFMFALLQREAFDIYPDDAIRHGLVRAPAAGPAASPSSASLVAEAAAKVKDTRSLCRLSQHFLEVFLAGNVEISLPDASDKIHGETTVKQLAALGSRGREPVDIFDAKKFQQAAARGLKTKIRRLYDIANVFIAVGILAKLENTGVRSNNDRPTFRWTFNTSAAELLRVYETMPDHMKEQQSPFPKGPQAPSKGRRDVIAAPLILSWPDEGPELFPPSSEDLIEPPCLLPPQPSPTTSEEADGFVHSPSEGLPPLPTVTSLAPPTTSAAPCHRSASEARRISLPPPEEAHLE